MTTAFPQTPDFTGHNAPSRIECDIYDLVVEGTIPKDIEGSWFRSIPDPQFPPMLGDDTYLSGDGMVSLFRFENGHVDFKMRYVQTERWKNERKARRSLHGLYRNPYTDDPSVRGKGRGAANTTPVWHAGHLLATKEDSRAWDVDPNTLETRGEWDYQGKLRSQTMTAHPRIDYDTGEMFFFGYEASGLATRDVAYCVADKNGELRSEQWLQVPYCALMHDFVVTKEHAVFPCFPITANLDRIKAGGPHWAWEGNLDSVVGIMPREGRVDQLRWFRAPATSAFHFMNAFTEGNKVHMDFSVSDAPVFPFIQAASGLHLRPDQLGGGLVRWTFDLSKPGDQIERYNIAPPGDMPRIADRDHMRDYEIGYYASVNVGPNGPPLMSGPVGAGFNALNRLEVRSGKMTSYVADYGATIQEHVHVPSKTPGHEGYLLFVVDTHATNLSEVFILEAQHLAKGPIARIKVPMRLRCAVHGTWVPADAPVA